MQQEKSNLEGEHVFIRKLRIFDARDVYINIRDKEIGKWTLAPSRSYPENVFGWFLRRTVSFVRRVLRFVGEVLRPTNTRGEFKLAIVLKESARVIGIVTIAKIDRHSKSAEIGFWIGKKHWERGLATEAVRLALKFAFNELKLHRIYAITFEKHIGARKVMEKCGFKLEGVMREAALKDNERHNILNYGILISEYEDA